MSRYQHLDPVSSNYQCGIRKRRSSNIQIIVFLEKVYKDLEQGQHDDVLYTDYDKGFDHVDQAILIDNFSFLGVAGTHF